MGREREGSDRRSFLRSVAVTGVVAAATAAPSVAVAVPESATAVAYRRSVHGRAACGACRGHAANRYYRTPRAAQEDPAHRGCDCPIVTHRLPMGTYRRLFVRGDVYDVRWQQPQARQLGR